MVNEEVRREIQRNQQRDRQRKQEQEDDGPIVDTAETIIDPLTQAIGTNYDDEPEGVKQRRRLNDEEQRPE